MSKLGQALVEALNSGLEEGLIKLKASPNITLIRKRLKLTQKEFAERFHIDLSTLRKWEQGRRKPD
jgi:putative transcriptional regulator